jgi:O-antigen ligase
MLTISMGGGAKTILALSLLLVSAKLLRDGFDATLPSKELRHIVTFLGLSWPILYCFLAGYQLSNEWISNYLLFLGGFMLAQNQGRIVIGSFFVTLGSFIATLALAHGLTENGALFSLFLPEHLYATDRLHWPFVNPNHLGASLLLPISITLHRVLRSLPTREKNLPWYLAALAIQLAALIGTTSRGACLAGLLLLIAHLLLVRHSSSKRGVLILVSGVVVLFFVTFDRLAALSMRLDNDFSLSSRGTLYIDALQIWGSRPILGVGPGAWKTLYRSLPRDQLALYKIEYLHSEPLQFLTEFGILGTFPLAATVLWILWRGRLRVPELSVGLLAIFLASCVDFPLRIPAILFMAAIGLGTALSDSIFLRQESAVESARLWHTTSSRSSN